LAGSTAPQVSDKAALQVRHEFHGRTGGVRMPYASLEDFIKAADVENKWRDLLESTAKKRSAPQEV
jgi:hypothetical protein